MEKEYIVSQTEGEKVFKLSNMDDFKDCIECNDDEYWSHVEGQLFTEDEFNIVDGVACPIFPTLNDF
jgi:hypothetical protein